MEFPCKKEIVELEAFKLVFRDMAKVDNDFAENIRGALLAAVRDTIERLTRDTGTYDEIKIALLQQQIIIQAQSSQYLTISDELAQKHQRLWEFATMAPDIFFDFLFGHLESYFKAKQQSMIEELRQKYEWHSAFQDVAKKGAQLFNVTLKEVNKFAKEHLGNILINKDKVFDEKTLVEEIIQQHLSEKIVVRDTSRFFEQANEQFKEAWIRQISLNAPNLERISTHLMAQTAASQIDLNFQFGAAEQTLLAGMGAGVVGSLGLAAGWHTLAYAFANVFPFVAVFSVVAAVAIGIIRKDAALKSREKQIEEAIRQYHSIFLTQFYTMKMSDLGGITLQKHLVNTSAEIITKTFKQWEERLLGKLNINHLRMLNAAFTKHLAYIQEALEIEPI